MKLSLCKTGFQNWKSGFQNRKLGIPKTGNEEFQKPEMRKSLISPSKNQVNTVTSTICDNQNDLFFSFVFFFFSFMRDAH